MKVGIFGQFYHKNSETSIQTLLDILQAKFVDIQVEDNFFTSIDGEKTIHYNSGDLKTFKELDKSFDLLITIGGDGTMLRAITYVHDLGIPIVGINTGRLGFLATIPRHKIENAIDDIINNNYHFLARSQYQVNCALKHDNCYL